MSFTIHDSDVTLSFAVAIHDVCVEFARARAKHGEFTLDGTMTGNPTYDNSLRLGALIEEVGEVGRIFTYDNDESAEDLHKELIQVANVALTWASLLNQFEDDPGLSTNLRSVG